MNAAPAAAARTLPSHRAWSARLTNFYPLYNSANDQVDPVLPVQPVSFQRVLPRYRLSTSETRDQGTGPLLEAVPGSPIASAGPAARTAAYARQTSARRPPNDTALGRKVDLLA